MCIGSNAGCLCNREEQPTKRTRDEIDQPKDCSYVTSMGCGQAEMVVEVGCQHIIGCELNAEGEAIR